MSFFFEKPLASSLDTYAGGEASLGDIASSSYDSVLYTGQMISSENALERAYDDRIEAVRQSTGIVLENPRRLALPEPAELAAQAAASSPENFAKTRQRLFAQRLAEIAVQHPEARNTIRPEIAIEEDAAKIASNAEQRAGQLASSRDGLGKWLAMFAGSAAAAIQDPIQAYSLAVGAGPAAGRTVAGRILNVGFKEALINGATEAAAQPFVQSWRKKAGLEAGFGEAAKDVAFSAILGGLFGGVAGGAGEIAARLAPAERDAAATAVRSAAPAGGDLARALDGDALAQARMLDPIRDALPAAQRGALDAIERERQLAGSRPIGADVEKHERMAASAERAVTFDDPRELIGEPDFDQVDRIATRLVEPGPIAADAAPKVDSLSTFLMRRGGLLDQKGEVSAVTGGNVSERFVGKLIREDGVPLDRARELAAEAGYFDGRYGSPELAMEKSTPADLLDLVDEDLRGSKVYPGGNTRLSQNVDTDLAYASDLVAGVAREMGPGMPDHLIERAVRLVQVEKMDVAEAAERVLIQAGQDEGSALAVNGDRLSLPGWTDEEMDAAMAARPAEPIADGLDNPATAIDEAELLTMRDIAELPEAEAGEWTRMLDELDTERDVIDLIEACGV